MVNKKFKELCIIEPKLLKLSAIYHNPEESYFLYLIRCEILRIDIYLKTWGNKNISKKDYYFLEKYLIRKI